MGNAVSKHYNLYDSVFSADNSTEKRNYETKVFDCCLYSRPMLEGEQELASSQWSFALNMRPPPFSLVVVSNSQESVEDTSQW